MRLVLLFFALNCSIAVLGQKGAVLLQVQPTNAIVRIGGKEYKNLTKVDLPAGKYFIEAWAPGRQYVKDSIEIFADAFVKFDTILAISDAYKLYSQQYKEYSKAKVNNALLKSSIVVFNAGITGVVMAFMPGDVKMHRDAANAALDNYNKSTNAIALADYKAKYEEEKRLYEEGKSERKKYLYKALPSLIAVYGISVFAWTRIKKAPPKPVLNTPNPFATMDLRLAPEFGNGYQPTGMSFRFSMKF